MNLYVKYRPTSLDQVKGNEELIRSLQGLLDPEKRESIPHSFLFHGPTGCGKTTIARILAQELGCSGNDLREVDIADFRGIDTIREIRKNSLFMATESNCRVWLLDECHKLSTDAQNALLKILEDTPPHVFFILCTTDPQKIISTVRGRCTQYQVNQLTETQMYGLLRGIVRKEGQELTKEIYDQIIETSAGHPRNAIVVLEQVLSVDPEFRLEISKRALEKQAEIIELCRVLLNPKSDWSTVKVILEGLKGQEPEDIRRVVLGYCQAILLKADNPLPARIIEVFWEPTYNIGFPGIVYCCYTVIKTR